MYKLTIKLASVLLLCLVNSGCFSICPLQPRSSFELQVDGPYRQIENPNVYRFEAIVIECDNKEDFYAIVKDRSEEILAEEDYVDYTISSFITMKHTRYGHNRVRVYRVEFTGKDLEPTRKPGECTGTWDEIKDCF